jgi:DNA-binding PadR family transcriptional regulator
MSAIAIYYLLKLHHDEGTIFDSDKSLSGLNVAGLVEQTRGVYSITAKGKAYIKALEDTPLPELMWVVKQKG